MSTKRIQLVLDALKHNQTAKAMELLEDIIISPDGPRSVYIHDDKIDSLSKSVDLNDAQDLKLRDNIKDLMVQDLSIDYIFEAIEKFDNSPAQKIFAGYLVGTVIAKRKILAEKLFGALPPDKFVQGLIDRLKANGADVKVDIVHGQGLDELKKHLDSL